MPPAASQPPARLADPWAMGLLVVALLVPSSVAATAWARTLWAPLATGGDFASFYYAGIALAENRDPYDTAALTALAQREGTRQRVNPFLYPPPFLLLFGWTRGLTLDRAYDTWFYVNLLLLVPALAALWWWRPSRTLAIALGGACIAFAGPLMANHFMGQVNLLIVALTIGGLALAERGHERSGGLLVGLAAMLKMTPALFVLWWLARGRWKPAVAACVGAALLSLVTLPVTGLAFQRRFFYDVLPGFASGRFSDLALRIDLPGNNSLPALLNQLIPGTGVELSSVAALLWRLATLLIVSVLGLIVMRNARVPSTLLGARRPLVSLLEAGAVAAALLVLPTFSQEAHILWLLLPIAALSAAWREGVLTQRAAALSLACAMISLVPMPWLRELHAPLREGFPLGFFLVRHARCLAALLLGGLCLWASHGAARAERPIG